ncbi:MAG: hypothetical protein AB1760_13520 [Pseudomonadota bacterium]|jgi:hypothetical protein
MQTLTELVAAVVVHTSAVAYSHFGVTIEPHTLERPPVAERKVARSAPAPLRAPFKAQVSDPRPLAEPCVETSSHLARA